MSSKTATALETIDDIMKLRKTQKEELISVIVDSIAAAFRQQARIIHIQPDWLSVKKSEKGEIESALSVYLRAVENNDSVPHGADDEVHELIRDIVDQAAKSFEKDPDKIDEAFCEIDEDEESISSEHLTDTSDFDDDLDDERKRKKPKKVAAKGGAKNKAKKAPKKAKENDDERLYRMKRELRDHLHTVRSLGKELCGRIRSLRFIESIHRFQVGGGTVECAGCRVNDLPIKKVGVLSSCGHVGCLDCLKAHAVDGKCVEAPRCNARVSTAHVISSAEFGLDQGDSSGGMFGQKLTKIVDKVKEIISLDDLLIIFCQFDDLKEKVAKALKASDISCLEVTGSVVKQVKALNVFQKEKHDKDDPRVLLLKMDDEQSAGLNLTNLNHAIFVHPLLAASQQEYDAYETQAIGRIRRFGQTKTVHVHRFLAKGTIDTEIFEQRSGRALSSTTM